MDDSTKARLAQLSPLAGQWTIEAVFPQAPPSDVRGHVIFEWGPGEAFLVQRWEVSIDEAPDGVAIIAADEDSDRLIQHYFDSRGVVRQYETSVEDGTWTLVKLSPGFAQRFRGEFSASGETIEGAWEKSDGGSDWEHDFRLIYRKAA
ncbi:MAG TPA: hypothetical protein VH275_04485 [Solirubrobacterales bacterium]|jgi:hypothetical protein|nr:hypothetical protein [Solirubrobacterales bacterium]